MRSVQEIRFRLRQELTNARLSRRQPSLGPDVKLPDKLSGLPEPGSFLPQPGGLSFIRRIASLAESICEHRFPLLGHVIDTGPAIQWRRDPINNVESGTEHFRRIPYLDRAKAGDHKIIWELNRHQHLVVLAQGWRLTGRREFLDEIPRQIESWWEQNPFMRGINWASALEVAFRALSWMWVYHLAARDLPESFRRRLAEGIFCHGVYLENNLSVYFSPNTHLLGEAVALHAIGVLFPGFPRSARWRAAGAKVVSAQMTSQVRADGSHFEQSSAYHVYALDLFLFHAVVGKVRASYREKLRRMADYLTALSSKDGVIPLLGDDDGGNLFHPFGSQRRYGARTLASCCVYFDADEWPYEAADLVPQAAWWMGKRAFAPRRGPSDRVTLSPFFPDARVALLSAAPAHIIADTRGFGDANAGHSHAHALGIVCRYGSRDVLIDPGTYTYTGEPEWRARFRGTAFHNTVRVDGLDQARGTGPFRWANKPVGEVIRRVFGMDWRYLHAACAFRGLRHERHFVWIRVCEVLAIVDVVKDVAASSKDKRRIEQFWHCGEEVAGISPGVWSIGGSSVLAVPASSLARVETGGACGWQSECPGRKVPRPAIIVETEVKLPAVMAAILFLKPPQKVSLTVETIGDTIVLQAGENQRIEFRQTADPIVAWS